MSVQRIGALGAMCAGDARDDSSSIDATGPSVCKGAPLIPECPNPPAVSLLTASDPNGGGHLRDAHEAFAAADEMFLV